MKIFFFILTSLIIMLGFTNMSMAKYEKIFYDLSIKSLNGENIFVHNYVVSCTKIAIIRRLVHRLLYPLV